MSLFIKTLVIPITYSYFFKNYRSLYDSTFLKLIVLCAGNYKLNFIALIRSCRRVLLKKLT